jgi:hypothetical protein
MCKCTPNIKTPFCGKPGCEWPAQRPKEHLPSDDLLVRLRRYAEQNAREPWIPVKAVELLALVECAERLKLVIAADDQATAELAAMGVPLDSKYLLLVDDNKAAMAKLEAL